MDISCVPMCALAQNGNCTVKINQAAVTEPTNFNGVLREGQINSVKQEIQDKFHVNVGEANGTFEGYIPGDVLYRMNTDNKLKEKVYEMLADYTGDKFQTFCKTVVPPVKKCTLVFDEAGDVVSTLEPDMEKLEKQMGKMKNNQKDPISYYQKDLIPDYQEDYLVAMQALGIDKRHENS